MGKIVDVSHHQGNIDWAKASKEMDLAIIRVQYGSKTIDRKYKDNVAGAKKYGVPFGHYAYGCYVSVSDAVIEAKDFLARIDKDAKFLVLDVEDDTLKACGPKNLAKASQAFIDTCKAAGYKVGVYISHHLYNSHGLNGLKADFLWIPRYARNDNGQIHASKPSMPCCIWQYTQCGKIAGVAGNVDLNVLTGDKKLDYFTGKKAPKPASKPKPAPAKVEPKKPKHNIRVVSEWYIEGSAGLAKVEKFFKDNGWNYRFEKKGE